MRLVGKVMATLMLATALLQTPGDSGLGATNCGFPPLSSVENLVWRRFILRAQSILQSGRPPTHP